MKTLRTVTRAGLVAVGFATTGALVLSGCGASNEGGSDAAPSATDESGEAVSGTLSGAGASTQQAAQAVWQAKFGEVNPDATVNYDPVGSGGGRKQFLAGGQTNFAGTDAYLDDEELAQAEERCAPGELIEIPLYISPIAIAYNLEGVDELNLPPEVLAGIFDQKITTWNDPAIAEANPDAELPDQPVAPVNRSDESGTTENFTEYLVAAAGDSWPYEVSGDWPVPGAESAQGTSGVIEAISAGSGTIGYADASQVGELTVASIGVGESFEQPTSEAAAKIVETSPKAEGRPQYSFAYDLKRDTAESGTYPIVLLSYEEACTAYEDADTTTLMKAYLTYVTSEEGQQVAADEAGSAPLSEGLREVIQPALDAME